MSKSSPKDRAVATRQDIENAIKDISKEDAQRLEDFAEKATWALHQRGLGIDSQDLYDDAIARTWAGDRKWYKEDVGFTQHLIGVMRSVRSHEIEKLRGMFPKSVTNPGNGGTDQPIYDSLDSHVPNSEDGALAGVVLRMLRENFVNDEIVLQIMEGLENEMTGPEIQEVLELSPQQYEAAMRRLRRFIRKLEAK